ncbi:30S ribosomal protein S1 [Granulicella arctica]|uniref:Small subunit ribosomal protein S1 n=1 Tax=Granulicella arctica TaxID=940613 RepID=A0A7Y9PIG1_9BACT|nr:30S ribosomal protein S1 [Granulicella arctica]NYF80497.1 small subunit ribosomal protein S1 [Granulicella arctica]
MSNETNPEVEATVESTPSFGEMLSQYEQSHSHRTGEGNKQLKGNVVSVTADSVFVDIGYKTEGVLPLTAFATDAEPVKPGDSLLVSVKGRNEEGYYELSKLKVEQPKDWESLEEAFAAKAIISGTVTGVVKGGLTVDVGVRAFMPGSRSGARDATDLEKLVGQQIRCRITKLDVDDEDVVVDRRSVVEEEERSTKEQRLAEVREGETFSGTVRSLAAYGAFIDLGGVDGLLHIGEISWARVNKVEEVLSVGQTVDVKVLKIDPENRRISLSMKQLLPHPWDTVPEKYVQGQRIRGIVTRTTDFGAFVELEPGVEGMVHLSEMSWAKKVRKADDMVKVGETVEAVILGINVAERRISLGLKQTLGDPWVEAADRFAPGSIVEGPISSFTKFGAFVQVAEGVEGMVHISEITADKRLNHPQDVLRNGQVVQAKVLEFDKEKRQLRLSIKQMVPTGAEEFFAEHHVGDLVTGRVIEATGERGRVELGEGVIASCRFAAEAPATEQSTNSSLDLSALTTLLNAKWKGGPTASSQKTESVNAGQIRSFRIVRLESELKEIELELA